MKYPWATRGGGVTCDRITHEISFTTYFIDLILMPIGKPNLELLFCPRHFGNYLVPSSIKAKWFVQANRNAPFSFPIHN